MTPSRDTISQRQLMRTWMLLMGILSIMSPVYQATPRSSYALFHRLVQTPSSIPHTPSSTPSSSGEWQQRGLLEIVPDSSLHHPFKIAAFAKDTIDPLLLPKQLLDGKVSGWSYQIGLGPLVAFNLPGESGSPDTGFAFTSFPLCGFLLQDPTPTRLSGLEEYINIWIRPTTNIDPTTPLNPTEESHRSPDHNLHLDLLGIQWTTSALSSPSASVTCHDDHDRSSEFMGTTDSRSATTLHSFLASLSLPKDQAPHLKISVRTPERLPEPILTQATVLVPAQLMADGTVKPAPAEKGWLAKYWMYILPVVVMLVVGGGPPPPEEGDPSPPTTTLQNNP